MDTPVSTARSFPTFAKRDDFLNCHLCRVQVKFMRMDVVDVFLRIGTEVYKLYPADYGDKCLYFGEFYSSKSEEPLCIWMRDSKGKEIYDNPKKRTCKLSTEKKPDNPRYVSYEWLWGLNSNMLRQLVDEPRSRPAESSTAVICFSFDPDELASSVAPAASSEPAPPSGAGRGSGREVAPGSPTTEAGRGRGARRDTLDGGAGRGRGAPRRDSVGSSQESDVLLVKRRISAGSEKDLQLPKVFCFLLRVFLRGKKIIAGATCQFSD